MEKYIYFAILAVLCAGSVVLQIFLSKKENKWLGLIQPILSLLITLFYTAGMIVPPTVTFGFIIQTLWGFLLTNIPTFIYLAIYFACRGKQRKKKQLEKMNIQDLE